ncbi:hypothetical protein TPAR_08229, partial [Tolypocladium paradoxum]
RPGPGARPTVSHGTEIRASANHATVQQVLHYLSSRNLEAERERRCWGAVDNSHRQRDKLKWLCCLVGDNAFRELPAKRPPEDVMRQDPRFEAVNRRGIRPRRRPHSAEAHLCRSTIPPYGLLFQDMPERTLQSDAAPSSSSARQESHGRDHHAHTSDHPGKPGLMRTTAQEAFCSATKPRHASLSESPSLSDEVARPEARAEVAHVLGDRRVLRSR